MSDDESSLPRPDNPLASVLVDLVKQIAAERADGAAATETLARVIAAAEWWKQYATAAQDFNGWLQQQLCQARGCTTVDVIHGWHAELDRRAKMRREVAA